MEQLLQKLLSLAVLCGGCLSCFPEHGHHYRADGRNIVIIYENDVHCAVDAYARLAGLRDAVADTAQVLLVSGGDFFQGDAISSLSKGQYIVNILESMGYDALTIGNHEFDYGVPHLLELLQPMTSRVTCTNLFNPETGTPYFQPYIMKQVGSKRIAFVGTLTPTSLDLEYTAFHDNEGRQKYDLHTEEIYSLVQQAVDKARSEGADYVIVLSHLGEKKTVYGVDSHGLVAATTGIDAVIDAHSHKAVEQEWVNNREGKPIIVTQTGCKLTNAGLLLIAPDGQISTRLIPIKDIQVENLHVAEVVAEQRRMLQADLNQVVCRSDVALLTKDSLGRVRETNIGDLQTDAMCYVTGADIAFTYAEEGVVSIDKGDITMGGLLKLYPYENYVWVAEATGKQILNLLAENTADLPAKTDYLPLCSGLRYTLDIARHEVSDVQVLNKQTGLYEPIDSKHIYRMATTNYLLSSYGFSGEIQQAKVVEHTDQTQRNVLLLYVNETMNGRIGSQYAQPQGRIKFIE